jgi:site-specific DNA-methyltransferase (adenine-specific)
VIIPFDKLWEQYERIIKDNGVIVLFGSEPFSSMLRCSNIKLYRYDWIWKKTMATLFQLVNKRPMKIHENICVFYKHLPTYNPIMTLREVPYTKKNGDRKISGFHQSEIKYIPKINKDTNFPVDVVEFSNGNHARLHPTQKPVDLFEYLIKTYTNESEIVLDNTAGVCTTAIACKNTNRQWICIEKEDEYCAKSVERINALTQ